MPLKDIALDQRFGRLVVIEKVSPLCRCRCDCGKETTVRPNQLLRGVSRSCGCLRLEINTSHGQTGTPEHYTWGNMIQRCTNPANSMYQYYGGRGITVCERWRSFETFLADMGPRPSPDHSIERRDVNGHYEPNNCYWATEVEQKRNRTDTLKFDYLGRQVTLMELSAETGISYHILYNRTKGGFTAEEAVNIGKPRAYRARKQ